MSPAHPLRTFPESPAKLPGDAAHGIIARVMMPAEAWPPAHKELIRS